MKARFGAMGKSQCGATDHFGDINKMVVLCPTDRRVLLAELA